MTSESVKVLFIEDDVEDFELFQFMFEANTHVLFETEHVTTLQQGLDRLDEGGVDVVLLDLFLPDSEGLEGVERLVGRFPKVPVVILTGLGDESLGLQAVAVGAQDYLAKGDATTGLLSRTIVHAIERQHRINTGDSGRAVASDGALPPPPGGRSGPITPLAEQDTRKIGSKGSSGDSSWRRNRARASEDVALTRLGDFRLDEPIGKGGMGVVYRGTQMSLQRPVAVKVLPKAIAEDKVFNQRFLREARAAASLAHPHVIQVYTVGIDEETGRLFFAMELVEGRNLNEVLEDGDLSFRQILTIVTAVAGALEHAWEKQMVHRDIKPGNIMIGEKGLVKVLDFGLAKSLQSSTHLTRTGAMLGTPDFMSPEHAGNSEHVDCRSDLYSLGLVLYRMLAGELPFRGDSPASLIFLHSYASPRAIAPLRKNVPEAFDRLLEKLLAKRPDDRIAEPPELLELLVELRASLQAEGLLDEVPRGPVVPALTFWEVQSGEVGGELLNTRAPPPTESGVHRALQSLSPEPAPRGSSARALAIALLVVATLGIGLGLAILLPSLGTAAWDSGDGERLELDGSGSSRWVVRGDHVQGRGQGYLSAGVRSVPWRLSGRLVESGADDCGVYIEVDGRAAVGLRVRRGSDGYSCALIRCDGDTQYEIKRTPVRFEDAKLAFAIEVGSEACAFAVGDVPLGELTRPAGATSYALFVASEASDAVFIELSVQEGR